MSFTVTQGFEAGASQYLVTVKVTLTRAETNSLFLSGDALVSWPPGELHLGRNEGPDTSNEDHDVAPARTAMFVSELARLADGLKIGYRQAAEAERAAQLMKMQLIRAGIEED